MISILMYALLWVSFGLMHSLLTLPKIKNRLPPEAKRFYRLSYNIFAAVHFLILYLIGRAILDLTAISLIQSDVVQLIFSSFKVAGFIVILLALRKYDLGLFTGISQLFNSTSSEAIEPLNTSGLNKWVRHPLYTGAFMYLWGGAYTEFGFWTAVFGSIYILIGFRHEEKKLISIYGEAYVSYQASVSAFFPLKLPRLTN